MLLKFPIKGKRRFVLLHGFNGSPRKDFFPWLKNQLEISGYEVVVPELPGSSDPVVEEQAQYVLDNVEFDENTVLLGHSIGAAIALKVLEKLEKPINKTVLVCGFINPGFLDHKRPFEEKFDWKFNFEKIKKNAGEVLLLRANNDSAVPQERSEEIQNEVGGEIKGFQAEMDHCTGKKEPFLLENLKPAIEVFTTRPDTTDGATFLVVAPEHPFVAGLLKLKNQNSNLKSKDMEDYVREASKKTEMERKEDRTKSGVFTGEYVVNPVTGKDIPVWVADYVLAGYGTGAIMAVPFADERDREFAEKFKLPIVKTSFKAQPEGNKSVNYHLRDWSISRQRYWGTPVPVIHCEKDGMVPVPYEDLPVELPYNVDYTPKGKPPLATDEQWLNVDCPKCKGPAKRDAETLDTFFDSAWYYYRYISPHFEKGPFDKDRVAKLMPVDVYVGGAEHTLGHTLYARFFTKFFKEIGLVGFDEFASKRIQHGVILGPDGNRMSKSKGNVVNPDDVVKEYGADTVRLYLCFMMPFEATAPWSTDAISGIFRFLKRVWELQFRLENPDLTREDLSQMHKTIKKVGEDLESFHFNTAVATLMTWLNFLSSKKEVSKVEYLTFVKLLSPFAPFITEEIWHSIDLNASSVHLEQWPVFEPKHLIEDEVVVVVQVNGKVRDSVRIMRDEIGDKNRVEEISKRSEKVGKYLEGKQIVKTIYVEGKILNFVVN